VSEIYLVVAIAVLVLCFLLAKVDAPLWDGGNDDYREETLLKDPR